ncbi:MAG: MFS transporter [bacterium]|nr:MFS transporter [bacterium]
MSPTRHPMVRIWFVTAAHTTVDFYMLFFPPLLAMFKTYFGLSLVEASLLPMVVSVFGNMPQPFMGYLGDRTNRMRLAALGVLVCGLSVSLIGLAPSAITLAVLLIFAAFGSSLFHPTGGGLVTASLPNRSNLAMAIFLTGGTLGMAIAPVVGTQIVSNYGLDHVWLIVFPCLIVSAALLQLSRAGRLGESTQPPARINLAFLRTRAMRPMWTLFAISVFRSLVHAAYVSFISILGEGRGWSIGEIGWIFSAYLVASTLGRIAGGFVGDRTTPRKLLSLTCVFSAVAYFGFYATVGSISIGLFCLAGFIFEMGTTTNIILAQRLLPQNTSTATGLVMGFAWGIAGLLLPVIGILADATSLGFALLCASALLVPGGLLVSALPATRLDEPAAAAKASD